MEQHTDQRTPNELPTFDGWTVDFRLQEFRRMIPDEECSFVPFESEEGEELLARWAAAQDGRPRA